MHYVDDELRACPSFFRPSRPSCPLTYFCTRSTIEEELACPSGTLPVPDGRDTSRHCCGGCEIYTFSLFFTFPLPCSQEAGKQQDRPESHVGDACHHQARALVHVRSLGCELEVVELMSQGGDV
jgi:hypothetical protein